MKGRGAGNSRGCVDEADADDVQNQAIVVEGADFSKDEAAEEKRGADDVEEGQLEALVVAVVSGRGSAGQYHEHPGCSSASRTYLQERKPYMHCQRCQHPVARNATAKKTGAPLLGA